ncbi:High affinity cationic amino acid transporter 1 [Liparis tanakae]|uniref:High affinity cationic amino acid transporter 1 n=1 Tax=Liparis tanakae TaxID=230148 RepID=A0A4Z2HED4_9TELE|nr:High affinity cationic amino acid transporter 1 [Liparis tanakae]
MSEIEKPNKTWSISQRPRAQSGAACSAALMAFLFDLAALVDLMSIGTLLAYSLVAICVLILRYQPGTLSSSSQTEKLVELVEGEKVAVGGGDSGDEYGTETEARPRRETFTTVCKMQTLFITVLCVILANCLTQLLAGHVVVVLPCVILTLLCIVCLVIICRQPESKEALTFKVPLLPWLPLFSVFVNIYLMMQLDRGTWCRFAVWMLIGFIIYFSYGIRNSSEGAKRSSPRKYEPALQSKSPIYTAAANDSDTEAGGSP